MRMGVCLAVVWSLCGSAAGIAADDLQAMIEKSAAKFSEAFSKQDAAAIAGLFTPEAEYVDADGEIFHGRRAIAAEYAARFAAVRPGKLVIELLSLRPIAEGVVAEDGLARFLPEAGGATSFSRYAATHVRQADGTWLMASVRELEPARMTAHDQLLSLSWLVGRWREEVDGLVIATEWKWTPDENFLMSEFSVQRGRDIVMRGTHRVGWDAEQQQFRSWIFDVAGGFGEGSWRRNEDGSWSVQLTRIDADGTRQSSRLTFAAHGRDGLQLTQDQIVQGGASGVGSSHLMVRQPPAPEKVE